MRRLGRSLRPPLNYGLEVNKAVRLLHNLQYVLNPDQGAGPFRPTRIRNALVIGGQFVIDLTALDYGSPASVTR